MTKVLLSPRMSLTVMAFPFKETVLMPFTLFPHSKSITVFPDTYMRLYRNSTHGTWFTGIDVALSHF